MTIHRYHTLIPNRWQALAWLSCIYLSLSMLFRVVLISLSLSEAPSVFAIAEALAIGLFYDLAFLCFFSLPFSLFNWLVPNKLYELKAFKIYRMILLFVALSGCIYLFAAEWFFWEEFTARFNFISVDYLVYRREVTENIYESYPVFLIAGLCLGLGFLLSYLFSKKLSTNSQTPEMLTTHGFKSRGLVFFGLALLSSLIFFGVDKDSRQFSQNRVLVEIASNGPYQFFSAFLNNTLDFNTFYATLPEEQAAKIFQEFEGHSAEATFSPSHKVMSNKTENKLNVVLVAIESFSGSFMQEFGNTENITPFFDSLTKDSLFFDSMYATGSRTTRGLEAISLSIPPTPGRSLVKRLDEPARYNIGSEFKNRDYDVKFFYGGYSYFDNMQDFFTTNGFDVVDRDNFASKETGFATAWGLADEYLYEQTLIEADKSFAEHKPFFSFLLTTSNHRPFTFPDGRIDMPSGSRSSVIKYTDWSAEKFIAEAKTKPWFDDTIFVFVADHCASSAGRKNLTVEKHHIPLFIYSPKHISPQRISTRISQIDIAPTLLGLLNFSYDSKFVGADVLNEAEYEPRAFIANYQYLGLFDDQGLTYLKPKKEIVLDSDPYKADISTETSLMPSDPRALKVISIYQAADRMISNLLSNS